RAVPRNFQRPIIREITFVITLDRSLQCSINLGIILSKVSIPFLRLPTAPFEDHCIRSFIKEASMAISRKDERGRALRKGEMQRKSDKRYVYSFTDPFGKRQYIYANDLATLR